MHLFSSPDCVKLGKLLLDGATVLLVACSQSDQAGTAARERETRALASFEAIAPAAAANGTQPAFAGAVGYGAVSQGGRGGRIMQVTSLADSGPGSLRACIDAQGPRVCVFTVSGLIRYTRAPPMIRNPFITIAGQTAPGGGITLAHSGGQVGLTPLVVKYSHDVIIRDIRVRNDRIGGDRAAEDSITIERSSRVIVDHVSASWARDELVNGYDDNDMITVSNSIFSYGIPRHDKCALLGSDPVDAQNFSFIGNVCAHNNDRNPDVNFPPGSCVEVVNNVLYNARSEFAEIWESYGGSPVSLVGNSFVAGPNTSQHTVGVIRQLIGSTGPAEIYLSDSNFVGNFQQIAPSTVAVLRSSPPCGLTVTPLPAAAAYDAALANAGAWPRDAIDQQVIEDVRNRTGHIVDQPGSIPPIATGSPYADTDRDGMDDGWEATNGANPKISDPWADGNGNGIANLDEFLDYRHASLVGRNAQP